MEYCKLQIGCMLVILYIVFIYYNETRRFKQKHRWSIFDTMLTLGIISIFFDGLTAYTVNHQESVSGLANRIFHLFFLLGLDSLIFLLFIYMLSITGGLPKKKSRIWLLCSPYLLNVVLVVFFIPELRYEEGKISNYSMGMSAYTCFIMVAVYMLLSLIIFFKRWRYIERHKRVCIFIYLLLLVCLAGYQMVYPEALLTSLCGTLIIIGVYMNHENPAVLELSRYHDEMVMGFATLVENKDGSTGGHIRRTTLYVKLLAEELRNRGYYRETLTRDYVKNLCLAAPMHDVGKISVPDVILQKPGRLTPEEFEQMKSHTISGGKIVEETFSHLGNEQYARMAYEVARHHHEKWNGMGYPDGLKQEEIPLCARIMAIADVFDAVSENRCYRKAMQMDKCFEIIEDGGGKDFDPVLAGVFLDIRDKVEQIHTEAGH